MNENIQNQQQPINNSNLHTTPTKKCKYCQSDISKDAKICPVCKKKQNGKVKWIIIGIIVLLVLVAAFGGGEEGNDSKTTSGTPTSEQSSTGSKTNEPSEQPKVEDKVENVKDKYSVGDTWENKNIRITYLECGEFTDFNDFNAPAEGNKVIYFRFEVENIGKSDNTVMYTDFHGYADEYEVNQSYAPEGTGMDFVLNLSAGRKGTGIVAFEVPVNSQEIEIEYSTNMFTSERIVFIYSE